MERETIILHLTAGIGKSTLLDLIGGSLEPTKGTITRNPKVVTAVVSGHSMFFCWRTVRSFLDAAHRAYQVFHGR